MASHYSRQRSRYKIAPQYDNLIRTGYVTGTYGPYKTNEVFEQISDYVIPNYHEKIGRGQIINNPCNYSKTTLESKGSGYGTYARVTNSDEYQISGPLTQYRDCKPTWSELSVTSRASIAMLYAIGHMDSTPYAFGEDVGEIAETLKFLRSPLSGLRKLARHIARQAEDVNVKRLKTVKGRKRAYKRYARANDVAGYRPRTSEKYAPGVSHTADTLLEWQFAVAPLVRSTVDLWESVAVPRPPLRARRIARGFSSDQASKAGKTTKVKSSNWKVFTEHNQTLSKSYRASILYEVSNPVDDWRRTYGLRNKDLPLTAWQLLPLSFMVDRLLNVSASIKAITNLSDPSVKILSGSVSSKVERTEAYQLVKEEINGWVCSAVGEEVIWKQFDYDRVRWTPSYRDTLPPFNKGGLVESATNTAELIALICKDLTKASKLNL